MLALSACTPTSIHNSSTIGASPVLGSIASPTTCTTSPTAAAPGRGKFSSAAAKTSSFLANLNPARWGRWSSSPPVAGRLSSQVRFQFLYYGLFKMLGYLFYVTLKNVKNTEIFF